MKYNRKKQARRGMALVTTMLLLLSLMSMLLLGMLANGRSTGGGSMATTNTAIQQSGARLQSENAFNLAESGVEYTMQWMNGLALPPTNTSGFAPPFPGYSQQGNRSILAPDPNQPTSTFSVIVYPDSSNFANVSNGQTTNNAQKKYLIESTGTSGGFTQTIHAYIHVASLSKYLVLVDKWPPNNWWVSGISTFDGPVHDNNSDGRNEDIYWKSNATSPMWTYAGSDAYEVGANVNWWKDYWFTSGTPGSNDWTKIFAGGQGSLTTGAQKVPFPTSSSLQLNAALNGTAAPTAGSPVGVTLPTGGGTYIHGDVSQMTLSVDPNDSTTQIVKIQQTDSNGNAIMTKLTMLPDAIPPKTLIHVDSLASDGHGGYQPASTDGTASGVTNGVVYCDGNIGAQGTAPGDPLSGTPKSGGVSGMIADNVVNSSTGLVSHYSALSIVTDHAKNCNINGSLTYHTARAKDNNGVYLPENQDSNFVKNAGTLGIVSDNVLIMQKDASGDALNNIEVDGTVMAYSLYEVDQYATRPAGNWENMGGYLSATLGVFGIGDSNGDIVNGMNNNFNYDARMANNPPPYFPTTGNTYDIVSWQRVPNQL
jgi:hypothetical protein